MKCALVTGGSRGIGRAICVKLASMGYHVLVNYQSNDAEANKTLDLIRSCGGDGELLKFDVSDAEAVSNVLTSFVTSHPESCIEILVNNAGIRRDNLLFWMTHDEWHKVLDISVDGFFYVTQSLLKNMLANKFGRIINIVSLSGLKGMPGQVNYSASKGAIISATKALAQEVGRKNVTVNAVAPGYVETDMTADLDEKSLKNMIPLRRFCQPEEVASLVGFLASKEASYITGEVISINGGLYT
ncbi:3-oxoacyl-ACP reductase FabG [Bacteroides propionicifaciens]|uniref:3-oxoacyl-ACP reductase FabG n=1 Tax=Bacteroides propionicifaciens TaxID=392838 RepID=UPI00046A135C|nr:3-oxoacyl-ACP reductase FabG [Bacteroides propionicifaciens]